LADSDLFDRLTGGSGQDTFTFLDYGAGLEAAITDFSSNVTPSGPADRIALDVSGDNGLWVGIDAFDASSAQVRLDAATSRLQVDSDGNGSADFEVLLTGISQAEQLTSTDFLFA